MEKFSLDEWLKDKSRKVVTRDGRDARIVFTEVQDDNYPILALVQRKTETTKEQPHLFSTHGVYEVGRESCLDLFFADEEEELTEFDYAVLSIISDHNSHTDSIEAFAKRSSKKLLDLARKELRLELDKETDKMLGGKIVEVYQKSRENTLKDLPKWKKAEKDEELDCHVAIQQDGRVVLSDFVQKDEYYITLDVLKKLPKE